MTTSQKIFIDKYYASALEVSKRSGVPFPVVLAMAGLESGWGKYAPGNNFFGIKAGRSWTGKTQIKKTKEFINGKWIEVNATFRAYDTPEEAFEDFVKVLQNSFPYAFAKIDPVDFVRELNAVANHKYATDPRYTEKIDQIITTIRQHLNSKDFVFEDQKKKILELIGLIGLIA